MINLIRFTDAKKGHRSLLDDRCGVITVAALRHPFNAERSIVQLPAGGSVADIMRGIRINPVIPARVFVDDKFVGMEQREFVYPQQGQLLTIRAVPASGQGGKDQELILVAIAAISAVATYGATLAASAGISAFAGVSSGAAAATGAGAASAGAAGTLTGQVASILGVTSTWGIDFLQGLGYGLSAAFNLGVQTLLKTALIPPPSTPVPKQETTPHSYTVSGTANAAAPFSPIPKLYGTRRIFPQYAASPYSELAGFNQYLRMLFLLGYGPLDISRIKIGDTAIEDYEDVE